MTGKTFGAVLVSLLLPQAPSLENVLSRAGEYVTAFHQSTRLIIADESYVQIYRAYADHTRELFDTTAAPIGQWTGHTPRETRSEFALVARPDSDDWSAFRGVFQVGGKTLRPERNRLERALTGSSATPLADARRISNESLKYNLGSAPRDVAVPTFALLPLMPGLQKGFTFTKKGEKKAGNTTVWVIGYAETQRPTLVTTADGMPQPVRGELWIEPASGRVVKTRVVFDSLDAYPDMKQRPERYKSFPRSIIDVTYGPEPKLNMWLPVEMKENHDRQVDIVTCTATYSNYRRLDLPGGV